ncbi:MAG: flagellar basal body P-ring formation protein FlgA [Betaproteobacteria bacterium]|nr:flagellar basal body P-ring formation protein FlgA [Betaproteobacteria bacterium]
MSRRYELAVLNRACAFALWLVLFASLARADAPAGEAIRMFLERETTGLPGRVSIELGAPDPQIRPAPCTRIEPFLPGSARMWGRTSIGLRCADGAAWSTYLQVNIHVFAPVLVANRSLAAGQALAEDDYRIEEIDLTLHPAGILQDAAYADKKELARMIASGQPLRREHFRPRPVVTPGDPVRLVYEGAGFTISTEAKSLGSATDGQTVRVQTESGKVIAGVARGGRLVEVRQ